MLPNPVKKKWNEGQATVGGWIWIPNSFSAEVMARQDFDFLVLDTQHGAMDFDAAFPVIQTITASGMPVFVRVGWNDPRLIMKYLDAGAYGIIVPMVNTREEAERAVAACRYPPEGIRSAGPFRASISAGANYQAEANGEIACVVMIETAEAVGNLEEILSVPGIDCAYIGPGDLGISMGFPSRYDPFEEPYRETFVKIRDAIQRHAIVPGLNTTGGPQAARFIRDGFKLITMTTDLGNMTAGARSAIASLKEALADEGPGNVRLTEELKSLVNEASQNGRPILVAYTDGDGQPNLSFRGSTQAYSDNQLAIWVRNPEGGLAHALERKSKLTLFYRDPEARTTLQFKGVALFDDSEVVRERVYNAAPDSERNADQERKGRSLVIDLFSVQGVLAGSPVEMTRNGS